MLGGCHPDDPASPFVVVDAAQVSDAVLGDHDLDIAARRGHHLNQERSWTVRPESLTGGR